MANNTNTAIVATAIIIATLVVAGAIVIIATQKVGSSGHINTAPGIGVYSDEGCTVLLTNINWGSLSPGDRVAVTYYMKNTGNFHASYQFTENNWQPPSAAQYLTITWNYDGRTIQPGIAIPVTMYLDVANNVVGITDFSNDINISVK